MLGLLGRAKKFITGKKQPEDDRTAESSEPIANSSAITIRPKTTLVSRNSFTTPEVEENKKRTKKPDILKEIRKKVIRIDKILKKNLKRDSKLLAKQKRQTEKIERGKKESELEKVKDNKKKSKLKLPGTGLFKAIFDFISNILIGRLLFLAAGGIDGIPGGGILKNVVKGIGAVVEKTIDIFIGFLDLFGSALLIGKTAIDSTKKWLRENKGDEAEKRFDGVLKAITNLFNAFVIVGSAFALVGRNPLTKGKLGGAKGALKKAGLNKVKSKLGSQVTKGVGSKIIKGGLGRTTTRLVGKTLGPQAMKAVGPVIKKIGAGFSRVPIVGSLIVAVSSLLAGEPLGQAAFKGLGSAIGGFAGSFIPIPPPIGTLIGSIIGTFIGDVLYVLILQKDPKRAGQMLMKGISDSFKMMFDFAGMAASFVKQGFGRLIKDFPTIDIPSGFGLQSALGKVAGLFGVKDDNKFMEDGRVVKLPNLALLTPLGLPFLVPHIAASFFPDIFGEGGIVNKIFGEGGTAYGGDGVEETSGDKVSASDEPMMTGIEEGSGLEASGTSGGGMITGPAGYDRIGAGAAYHVDTKFHSSLGMGGMISALDQMSSEYESRGKEIVFSGQGYARLKPYSIELDTSEKQKLLNSAINAHSHSTFMRAEGFLPFDYYIPDKSAKQDLYHPSTEKADIILPSFGGETKIGSLYGGYGKSADIYDSSGNHVAMTGHGDLAYEEGGETLSKPHTALIAEKGPEFVIDTDSYMAIKKAYPGLLPAINEADGAKALQVLMDFASYERPQEPEPEMAMAGGGMNETPTYSGDDKISTMGSSSPIPRSSDNSFEITYKFG